MAAISPVDERQRGSRGDALPFLFVYVFLLFAIPSQLIVHPLGAAGTPAQIMGIGLFFWWLLSRIATPRKRSEYGVVKSLLACFALALLASYVAGMTRPIVSSEEVNSADRALLSLCAWSGVVLVFIDGIRDRARLDRILRFIAGGATFVAVLGLLQFFFKLDLAHYIRVPGLTANGVFGEILSRSKFGRVAGTTSHPIEFGVVLASVLPLLIHYARYASSAGARRAWWVSTGVVAVALPMSVARSAIIGAAVVFVWLFRTWPARLRAKIVTGCALGMVAMSVVVPGLLGTIKSLFLNAGSDPSTAGRTEDYGPAFHYVSQRPVFGRGIGTFIPSLYRTLDNQYLGLLVEAGVVGLLATFGILIGTLCVAGRVRRVSPDPSATDLAQSLKAGIMVSVVNAAIFDLFGFPMAAGVLFLLIGAVGALSRFCLAEQAARSAVAGRRTAREPALIGLALGVAALALTSVSAQSTTYRAVGAVVLYGPAPHQTMYWNTGRANYLASALQDVMTTDNAQADLASRGVSDYDIAVGQGSLMYGTDVAGSGSVLHVDAYGADPEAAQAALKLTTTAASSALRTIQLNAGVAKSSLVIADVVAPSDAYAVHGHRSRGLVGFALIVAIAAWLASGTGRRMLSRRRLLPVVRHIGITRRAQFTG